MALTSLNLKKKNASISHRKQRQKDEACKASLGYSAWISKQMKTEILELNSVSVYQIPKALIFAAAHNAHTFGQGES